MSREQRSISGPVPGIRRRAFLRGAGLGLLSAGAPLIVPSGVLGGPGRPSANALLGMALIGCGNRGMGLLPIGEDPRCRLVALCDPDSRRLEGTRARLGGRPDGHRDFREILARPDIDAVLIATPDHWHAPMTVLACEAGKDVYCEKPLCRTIDEGRRMVEAARRFGRVVQVGTQYRSNPMTRAACGWVRAGRLGAVRSVRLTHPPNRFAPCEPPRPVPPELDWDLWLGPAPWAEYHPLRCHFTFRWFMDYGSGSIADNGVHMFGVVSWAMGADRTGPVTVEAEGRVEPGNFYDVPVEMRVRYSFDDPRFEMVWEQGSDLQLDLEFVGDDATLGGFWGFGLRRGRADLSPARPGEVEMERSDSHSGNWLDCIATRARPVMDVEIGHRITAWSHLGNIAFRLGRPLRWDPVGERFVGDPEADRMLGAVYRAPWRL